MYLKVCRVNFRFNRMKGGDRVFRLDAARDTGGQEVHAKNAAGSCKSGEETQSMYSVVHEIYATSVYTT